MDMNSLSLQIEEPPQEDAIREEVRDDIECPNLKPKSLVSLGSTQGMMGREDSEKSEKNQF